VGEHIQLLLVGSQVYASVHHNHYNQRMVLLMFLIRHSLGRVNRRMDHFLSSYLFQAELKLKTKVVPSVLEQKS